MNKPRFSGNFNVATFAILAYGRTTVNGQLAWGGQIKNFSNPNFTQIVLARLLGAVMGLTVIELLFIELMVIVLLRAEKLVNPN